MGKAAMSATNVTISGSDIDAGMILVGGIGANATGGNGGAADGNAVGGDGGAGLLTNGILGGIRTDNSNTVAKSNNDVMTVAALRYCPSIPR